MLKLLYLDRDDEPREDTDRGGSSPDRSPNDDRSDVMNPNNDAYWDDLANRESQK